MVITVSPRLTSITQPASLAACVRRLASCEVRRAGVVILKLRCSVLCYDGPRQKLVSVNKMTNRFTMGHNTDAIIISVPDNLSRG